MFEWLKKIFGTAQSRTLKRYRKIVEEVNRLAEEYRTLDDWQLYGKTDFFKRRIAGGESLDQILPEAYAVVKETCRRLKGTEVHVSGYNQKWDMVPFDVQIIGAIALHNGTIAEMQTGEGKTLTAVMPLYLGALTGKPVHLVTVNDYLAKRDREWMEPIFQRLGITTATLLGSTPQQERKAIYQADIVYGTAAEFGFDYLRDNSMVMTAAAQVQRGYYYAIVDEIDSILIDEARTPLIISGPVPESRQMYGDLKEGVDAHVRLQREFCNKLATSARKILEELEQLGDNKLTKEQKQQREQAFVDLWVVSKGMPRNKILRRIIENPDYRAELDQKDLYFHSDMNKEERLEKLAQLYMIVDEKANEYELTDKGIHAWVEETGGQADDFVMLDLSELYLEVDQDTSLSEEEKLAQRMKIRELDAERKERAHNLKQLLRGYLLMERDVDYMVQDSKIVIVDEHTGRPQPGRRFSDGLHQAIEAKEGVPIQKETQTYATVTLQNYFRLYDRLAGMTGTAATEASEFKEIYKVEVLEIPTNKPCPRKDFNDEIYMTEREKYAAIVKKVTEIHEQGRPILLGTESVDISEKLSRIFRQMKLPHTVLNAKQHEREAEIIAAAGQKGAITIATNMAGRGTDIKLGEGVAGIGGLFVMGTSRHQSRRIDRQLRGRCARQGDPGSSLFYVSFEDPLMRLFASPKITTLLQRLRPPEGEPISASMLNRSIETAQKRIEQRNYMVRKHTLEYDDVMNKQRQEVYGYRNELIHAKDVLGEAEELLRTVCLQTAEQFLTSHSEEEGWDPEGYRHALAELFPVSFEPGIFDQDGLELDDIHNMAADRIVAAFKAKFAQELQKIDEPHRKGAEEAVRHLMLRKIDQIWQEHLLRMDHLRNDVSLRTVAQRDPLLEFKHEAFKLFDILTRRLFAETAQDLFRIELVPSRMSVEQFVKAFKMERERLLVDNNTPPPEANRIASLPPSLEESELEGELEEEAPLVPVAAEDKVGRNEPCPCGSGRKFKKCCGIDG